MTYYEICIFSFSEHPGNWNTGGEVVLELDPSTGVARTECSGKSCHLSQSLWY